MPNPAVPPDHPPEGSSLKYVEIVEVPPYHYGAIFERPAS